MPQSIVQTNRGLLFRLDYWAKLKITHLWIIYWIWFFRKFFFKIMRKKLADVLYWKEKNQIIFLSLIATIGYVKKYHITVIQVWTKQKNVMTIFKNFNISILH